jgi:hypothetical protein
MRSHLVPLKEQERDLLAAQAPDTLRENFPL